MKLIRPLLTKTCITGFIKTGIIFFMWEHYEKKKYGNFILWYGLKRSFIIIIIII